MEVGAQNTPTGLLSPTCARYQVRAISPDGPCTAWLAYSCIRINSRARQIFTEGLDAAQYVADHLKQWGVKPLAPPPPMETFTFNL